MKNIWNKNLPILLSLLLLLTIIPPMPALASQQKLKSVKITKTEITQIKNKEYRGKKQIQKPVIMNGRYKLKWNTDYTLSYKNNTKIGSASVIIKGKGKYSGSVTRTFQINPAKTVLDNAVLNGNSAVLTWKKSTGVDGYQIYYSKSRNGKFTGLSAVNKSKTSYTDSDANPDGNGATGEGDNNDRYQNRE